MERTALRNVFKVPSPDSKLSSMRTDAQHHGIHLAAGPISTTRTTSFHGDDGYRLIPASTTKSLHFSELKLLAIWPAFIALHSQRLVSRMSRIVSGEVFIPRAEESTSWISTTPEEAIGGPSIRSASPISPKKMLASSSSARTSPPKGLVLLPVSRTFTGWRVY